MTSQQDPIRRRADGSIDTDHYARLSMQLRGQAIAEARRRWANPLPAWLRSTLEGSQFWRTPRRNAR